MSATGSTSSHGTHSRSPSRSRSPPPYSDGRYSSRYRYDYNYRSGRSMSAALDDYRDLRDRERDRERMMRDDRYMPPRRDRYAPYYRDELHYPPPPPPHSYSKLPPGSLRRDEAKDKIPLGSSSSGSKDLKDDKPNPPAPSEPYGRYVDWRERRYRDEERRRDYDRRYMRYDTAGYGPPPFSGDSYRNDRDLPPSPGIPYYERDRMDDRDYYRRPPPSDYDRYRPGNGSGSGRGGPGRPGWRPQTDDRRIMDRERDRDKTYGFNRMNSESNKPGLMQSSVPISKPPVVREPPRAQEEAGRGQKQPEPVSKEEETEKVCLQESKQEPPEAGQLPPEAGQLPPEAGQLPPEPEMKQEEPERPRAQEEKEKVVNKEEGEDIPMEEPRPEEEPSAEERMPSVKVEENIPEETGLDVQPEKGDREMTQEQIVERIDHIENEISRYEEMLEAATRREEGKPREEEEEEEEANEEERKAQHEEAKKQALQAMGEDTSSGARLSELADSPMMRKRPQLLINQLRGTDEEDEVLWAQILGENQRTARENARSMGGWPGGDEAWSDEEEWSKPLHARLEDYACYQANERAIGPLRLKMARTLGAQGRALKRKEGGLKKEFKSLYEQWKEKNLALDRIRDHERKGAEKYQRGSNRRRDEPEEYIDHVIFVAGAPDALRFKSNGASTPYTSNGLYTSDAARSEAELLEIIQSLETAEMRNPESRAKKTTATIPPMIMDLRERMRTFDDRSGLIEDPLMYYHTGPDTGDIWNQQEVTTFMESYMMYPKQFERISRAVGTKTAPQCVLFYYRKKKKIDFKALMKKGRRGKTNKHRDRIAAAIRAVTGDSGSTPRKAKSKGSALMADIGEAQNSRKAKEKDAERKSRELRDLDPTPACWPATTPDRKRPKRPSASVGDENDLQDAKRRTQPEPANPGHPSPARRKGRSPRESMQLADLIYPSETAKGEGSDDEDKVYSGGSTKWSDREKETVIDAFRQHGRNFSRVSALLPTKTEEQVRNFYHNFKRKNGPNVFGEGSLPVSEAGFGTRVDLKAEEEDAAAALVGMFQMGANPTRTAYQEEESNPGLRTGTPPPQLPPGGGIAGAQRRRRIRTASGRTENTLDEDWVDGGELKGQRKPNRTSSLTDKRSSYSSYWSVSERNDFLKYLETYGRDWEKLSVAMKTKTVIQVRNFYTNNEDRMQLKDIVDRFHASQHSSSHLATSQPLPSYAYPATGPSAYPPIPPRTGFFSIHHPVHPPPPSYPPTVRPPLPREPEPSSSAVTKVADLLNNDDPAEPNQNSWETWFGS